MKTFWINGNGVTAAGTGVSNNADHLVGSSGFQPGITTLPYTRKFNRSGTFSKLYTKVASNTRTADTNIRFVKNNTNGNQLVVVPTASAGYFQDNSGTDSISPGDDVRVESTIGGTGALNTLSFGGVFDNAGSDYTSIFTGIFVATLNGLTRYFGFSNTNNSVLGTSDVLGQLKMKRSGTLKNLTVYTYTNSKTTDDVIRVRLNGVDTALTVPLLAGVTGLTEDLSDTVSLVSGDLVNYVYVAGASSGTVGFLPSIDLDANAGMFGGSGVNSYSLAAATTAYMAVNLSGTSSFTQDQAAQRIPLACILSNFRINVVSNSSNYTTTATLQKNGVDTAIVLTINSASTGWMEDNTNTLIVAEGDTINWKLVSGAGTGSVNMCAAAVDYTEPTPPPPPASSGVAKAATALGIGISPNFGVWGGSGGSGTVPFSSQQMTANTLVSPVSDPAWNYNDYSSSQPATFTQYNDPTDGQCAFLNQGANASGAGIVFYRFWVPAGTTSVDLTVEMKKPTGDGVTGVGVGVHDITTGYVGNQYTNSPLNTTMTTYTLSYSGLTAGRFYAVSIICNFAPFSSAQARAIIKSIKVTPTTGTGIFAPGNTFYRIHGISSNFARISETAFYASGNTTYANTLKAGHNAALEVQTTATDFACEMIQGDTSYPNQAVCTVNIDNQYNQSLNFGGIQGGFKTFTLSAGNKKVGVNNGGTLYSGGDIVGTYVKCLYVNGPTAPTKPSAGSGSGLWCYGDSISNGYLATALSGFSPWDRLWSNGKYTTTIRGAGSEGLFTRNSDATARTNFVAQMAGTVTGNILLAIGTNDYGLNLWSAANFGTAYADLLDKMHTAFPSATIYCVSPISRSTESANSFGNTLGDYRTQIQTAAGARSSYCVYIDGTTLVSVGNLVDGVHPGNIGAQEYYIKILRALGNYTITTIKDIPGLATWLDFDFGVTLNSTTISALSDKSKVTTGVVQPTAANQPLYSATGIAGKPAGDFDGVDDTMGMTGIALPGAMTFFTAYQMKVVPNMSTYYLLGLSSGSNPFTALTTGDALFKKVTFQANGTSNTAAVGFDPTLDTNPHTLVVSYNGGTNTTPGNYTAKFDGSSQALTTSSALNGSAYGANLSLGGIYTGTTFVANAKFACNGYFNRQLDNSTPYSTSLGTMTEAAFLDAYLSAKIT